MGRSLKGKAALEGDDKKPRERLWTPVVPSARRRLDWAVHIGMVHPHTLRTGICTAQMIP